MKGKIAIYYASSPLFIEEKRAEFFEGLNKKSEVKIINCEKLTPNDLEIFLESRGLFDEHRLLIMTQAEKLTKNSLQKLIELLQAEIDGLFLMIEYTGDLSSKNKNLSREWQKLLEMVKPVSANPSSGRSYILKRLKEENIQIEEEAIIELEEVIGKSLTLLPKIVEILIISSLETKTIKKDDVVELIGSGRTGSAFELIDAFFKKDRDGVLKSIETLKNDPSASPIGFLSLFFKQTQNLAKLISLIKNGKDLNTIKPEHIERNFQNWQLQKLKNSLNLFNEKEVLSIMEKILFIDLSLKGDPIDPWLAIEKFLLKYLI